MWKLKCGNNEKIVKYTNIIGRNEIATFFANNGYAMMDCEMESITDMRKGETLQFYFPNKKKHIDVMAV